MALTRLLPVLLVSLALAGCGDDGGDGGDTTTTDTTTSPTTTTNGPGPGEMEPIVLTGQVTGFADCSLAQQGNAPASPDPNDVPQEAWNGTYTLEFESESPSAALCISWGDGDFMTSTTGTVPEAVTRVRVAANLAPTGADYTITIEPVPQGM